MGNQTNQDLVMGRRQKTHAKGRQIKLQKRITRRSATETNKKIILQTYKSLLIAWCTTTAINNMMQHPAISSITVTTTNGSFGGYLDEDIETKWHTIPDLDYIMALLTIQGFSGAPIVLGQSIQLAATEQHYHMTREGGSTLVNEENEALLSRDLPIF